MFASVPILNVVSQPFKRSQLGLFQGKTKQYGNNVPFSKHKTRRTWLPNVQQKRLASETLGRDLRVKVTTRALKTIKKHGGLDNYVEKTRSDLIGYEGMRIRLMIRDHAAKALKEEGKAVVRPWAKEAKALAEAEAIARTRPSSATAFQAYQSAAMRLGVPKPTATQILRDLDQQQAIRNSHLKNIS